MEIVQHEVLVNKSTATVNEWLAKIPADKIVSVSWQAVSWEGSTDEFVSVFYKVNV